MTRPFRIANESSRERAIEVLKALDLSKPWTVAIRPEKTKRSLNQNALYHKLVGIIAEDTGESHARVHEWIKGEFLPPEFITIDGKTRECRKSTTELDTKEMSRLIDRVYAFGTSELGLILPVPDDLGRAA